MLSPNTIYAICWGYKDAKMATEAESGVYYDQTPEIYLGYARAKEYGGTDTIVQNRIGGYFLPETLPRHAWALNGHWWVYRDKIVSASEGAVIKLHFMAKKVYAVMGVVNGPVVVSVSLNAGNTILSSKITVKQNQLYTLAELPEALEGTIELKVEKPGLEIYTFTFG